MKGVLSAVKNQKVDGILSSHVTATTKTVYPIMQKHHMCNPSNLGTVAEQPASNSQDLRCHARVSAGNNGIKSAVDPADLLIPGLAHIKRPKEDHRAGGNNSEATEGN